MPFFPKPVFRETVAVILDESDLASGVPLKGNGKRKGTRANLILLPFIRLE